MPYTAFLLALSALAERHQPNLPDGEILALVLAWVFAQNVGLEDQEGVFLRAAELAAQLSPVPERMN